MTLEARKGNTSPNCTLSAAGSLRSLLGFSRSRPTAAEAEIPVLPLSVRPGLVAAALFGDFRMRGCKRRSDQIARHKRRATSLKDVR